MRTIIKARSHALKFIKSNDQGAFHANLTSDIFCSMLIIHGTAVKNGCSSMLFSIRKLFYSQLPLSRTPLSQTSSYLVQNLFSLFFLYSSSLQKGTVISNTFMLNFLPSRTKLLSHERKTLLSQMLIERHRKP